MHLYTMCKLWQLHYMTNEDGDCCSVRTAKRLIVTLENDVWGTGESAWQKSWRVVRSKYVHGEGRDAVAKERKRKMHSENVSAPSSSLFLERDKQSRLVSSPNCAFFNPCWKTMSLAEAILSLYFSHKLQDLLIKLRLKIKTIQANSKTLQNLLYILM